jgi:hypothetical protein
MIKVDVTAWRELRTVIVALKLIGPEFSKLFRTEARREIEPEWKMALERSRPNRLQRHVLVQTSRVSVSDRQIRLRSGTVGKLSSGEPNAEIARAVEFGQSPAFRSRYRRRSEGGGTHTVVRRTAIPVGPRKKTGKVVYRALERFVPRAAEIAVNTFAGILQRITRG